MQTAEISTPTSGPDWSKETRDVFCPLCDYNLRGLIEPRCPECGHRFIWPSVLEPHRNHHPYLFEHYPDRNAWSFVRTILGVHRPTSFWRKLKPEHPLSMGRLLLFSLLTLAIGFLGMLPPAIALERAFDVPLSQIQGYWKRIGHPQVAVSLFTTVFMAWWPILSFLSLMIFQVSMARLRILPIQVLRCTIYSAAPWVWAGFVPLFHLAWAVAFGEPDRWDYSGPPQRMLTILQFMGVAAVYACAVGSLIVASRRYLRFDHPAGTILASQAIILVACTLTGFILYFVLWF